MTYQDDEKAEFDRLFEQLPQVVVSPNLARKVAEIPLSHPQTARWWWPFPRVWQPLVGLALAGAMGVLVAPITYDNTTLENESSLLVEQSASGTSSPAKSGVEVATPASSSDESEDELNEYLGLALGTDFYEQLSNEELL